MRLFIYLWNVSSFSQEIATADGPTSSKPLRTRLRTSKGVPHGAIAQGQIAPPKPKEESGPTKTFKVSQSTEDTQSSDVHDRLALGGVILALLFMIFGPYILDMLSAFYQNLAE